MRRWKKRKIQKDKEDEEEVEREATVGRLPSADFFDA